MVKGIRTVVQRPERFLSLQNVSARAKVASRLLCFVQILLFFDSFWTKIVLFLAKNVCCLAEQSVAVLHNI